MKVKRTARRYFFLFIFLSVSISLAVMLNKAGLDEIKTFLIAMIPMVFYALYFSIRDYKTYFLTERHPPPERIHIPLISPLSAIASLLIPHAPRKKKKKEIRNGD